MGEHQIYERDSHLAALTSYAEEARGGEGRLVLISGEAGIGKSTVVEALQASWPDATWWWGACDGLSTPRALGPLADVAAQAGGDLAAACSDDAARDVRFDALLRMLRDGQNVHVLVIEDVHWADEATLDMLRFLGRRIRTTRALVIVTYRDDALSPDDPLRVILGDLATHRTTRRVSLGPLSVHAVRELAADTDIDPAELYRLTGGSPFFVTEVIAAGATGVPGSARDVVLARAAGLTAEARHVLECAALLGTYMTPTLLAAASGAVAAQLDELVRSGILVGDGIALRFRHEIARQAVQAEIAPHHTVELHRAILETLLGCGTSDDARLAFHADAAGDAARVLEHAPKAARAAADVGSHREAAAQLERAVRYADTTDLVTRGGLYDALADELSLVERWDEAAATSQAAIAHWHAAGDALREGAAEARLATVMWRLCRGSECVAARRRARELLAPLGPTEELGNLYAIGGDTEDPELMSAYITQAAEIAVQLDIPALRVRALNGVGYLAACRMGDYETPLCEALDIALAHGMQQQVGQSYANLTEYYAADLKLAEAEPLFLEALAYCAEHDVATFGNCVRGHYALALLDQGRWDEALRQAHEVLATRASPINRLTSLVTAGLVNARLGDPAAQQFLAEAEAVATGVDEAPYLALARLALVEAAWLAEDPEQARAQLGRLRSRLTSLEVKPLAAVIAWEHRLGVVSGDVPAVAPYAAQVAGPPHRAAQIWDEMGLPYHAALALADSDDETDLREAVHRLDQMSPPAARVVRQRMRDHGLRAIPVGVRASTRSDPQGLTRREREVLHLVQDSLTNEQIAQRLVISVKTVDHHVSSVLAKLGIASRRDAIARAGL